MIKKNVIGLVRLDKKPLGKIVHLTRYYDPLGAEISREEYDAKGIKETETKKYKKKRVPENIPYFNQPLWMITEEVEDSFPFRKWVYARYAKTVAIEEWESYPFYPGKIFEKR